MFVVLSAWLLVFLQEQTKREPTLKHAWKVANRRQARCHYILGLCLGSLSKHHNKIY